MEYVYAAMLLHSAGAEVNDENVKKVLEAAGVKPDPARVKALTASLADVDIEEAINTAVMAAPAPAAPVAAPDESRDKKKEEPEKDEEKEEEVSEEEAAAGLGALFG